MTHVRSSDFIESVLLGDFWVRS